MSESAMSESGESRGLQISLKWLLIGVPFAGATLGLLGRSFYRDPNEFRLALMLVTVVAPFLLAVGTIVRLGWRSGHRTLAAWGLLLLVTPFVGYGVRAVADRLYGIHGYGIVDNATLIKQRLPNELATPWVWQELEQRMQSGSLSKAEADEVVQTLTSHMKKNNPQGWGQPLHWEGNFIKLASQKQLVTQQTLFDLCDAFYGSKPELDHFSGMPGFRGNNQIGVEFGNSWGFHSDLPIKLIWFPTQVFVDGNPVQFETTMSHGDGWDGSFSGDFTPGDHDLTVELQCAYVDNGMHGIFSDGCVERKNWPKQLHKTWTASVTEQRHFVSMGIGGRGFMKRSVGQPLSRGTAGANIKLVTRAADDPLTNKAVEVKQISITPGQNNVSTASLQVSVGDHLSIPISCDVTAKMDGRTFQFGTYYAGNLANGTFRSAAGYEPQIGNVGESIDTAEVILTPNPKHIQEVPGVTEIWGKPIILKDVPVERLDLKDENP